MIPICPNLAKVLCRHHRSPNSLHVFYRPATIHRGPNTQSYFSFAFAQKLIVATAIFLEKETTEILERSELGRTSAQQKQLEEFQGLIYCQICKENFRDTVILPCKHFLYCNKCLEKPDTKSCPACLVPISDLLNVNGKINVE